MKRLFVIYGILICTICCADTETITWYAGGTTYATTTCESGDDVIAPTLPPTPKGYTGGRWGQIDDTMLCKNYYGHVKDGVYKNWVKTTDDTVGQWNIKIVYPYYTVHGKTVCSDTAETVIGKKGTPNETFGTGGYCWCKATGLYSATSYYDTVGSQWVFAHNYGNAGSCEIYCANYCARGACENSTPQIRKQFLDFTIGVVNE